MPRQTKKFDCKYSELKNSFIISSPKKKQSTLKYTNQVKECTRLINQARKKHYIKPIQLQNRNGPS